MASKLKNLSALPKIDKSIGTKLRIGIVVSEYHSEITSALSNGCIKTLLAHGIKKKNIILKTSPGAFELPLSAKWLFQQTKADAVICLGCVIKGDTDHDVYINHAVAQAIMQLGLKHGIPFVFGLLTTTNMDQAKARAGGKLGNKGVECAVTALKMLQMKSQIA